MEACTSGRVVMLALPAAQRSQQALLRTPSAWRLASSSRKVAAAAAAPLCSSKLNLEPPITGLNRSGGEKLRVAVDVDEVLGRFVHSLNAFLEDAYGLQHKVGDYWVYEFARIWGCSPDESNHRVHAFFESHHFAEGIEVIPGAYDSLTRLRDACDLHVVTSRQHVIEQPTLEWIQAHFPGVFSQVHFGNHFALAGASRKKSEICAAIGASVLIDDNPTYAVECAQAGIHVLLYDWEQGYPWSKAADGLKHDLITRVRNWDEVEQVLSVLAAQGGAKGPAL